ncbi:MAG: MerR family DNA-binding transcriptional regulator, partial [Limnospira sp. PMC 1286.21]|uniref:MerR family DNA-binding transcriptional regulator n=1 Tax=Limnospira sp. PMC 1286.21 TaxID=2981069 RepID=UPI0028E17129
MGVGEGDFPFDHNARRVEDKPIARYVKPKEAAQILGVHERTLRRWDSNGSIETIRTPAGQRRYNVG